jgi:TfoX/Sxy family transcriptional regulator of competence genes
LGRGEHAKPDDGADRVERQCSSRASPHRRLIAKASDGAKMAYDEALAQRIRDALRGKRGISEKKMFGGIAFLLHGHMFVGIADDALMARVGPAEYERALTMKHVREMDFTGNPMRGYVFVGSRGLKDEDALKSWLQKCVSFVSTLPPKAPK